MPRRNSQAPTTLAAEEKFKRDSALAQAKFDRDGKKTKPTSKRRTKTVTAGGPPPPPAVEKDDDEFARRPEHNKDLQTFKSYIIEPENYNLHTLYKTFKKEKSVQQTSGYFAGHIILSALHEFEKKCNFYLNTTKHTTKKQLKSALYKDLELLKTQIEEM